MSKPNQNGRRVAFGGILAGLSLLCLFLSGIVPFAEFTCPALAGIVLTAVVIDFGRKTAWLCYAVVALLSLVITPNKEAALLFVFFLGYYPILKSVLEQTKSRVMEWFFKLLIFNAAMISAYAVIIYLLGMTEVLAEMNEISQYGALVFLLLGNLVFLLYDYALSGLIAIYCAKLRPKLKISRS